LYELEGGRCGATTVSRSRSGETTLTRIDIEDDVETTRSTQYVLEPLFGRAMVRWGSVVERHRDGSEGRGASGSLHPPVALVLGDGVMLLGSQAFYFRRRDCEAAL
jgi:hypothetical protein